jgi:hypothetical protein
MATVRIVDNRSRDPHRRRPGSTPAQLSVVNRDIHLETLPVPYETVKFDTVAQFEHSVRFKSPMAWKYTRYVALSVAVLE